MIRRNLSHLALLMLLSLLAVLVNGCGSDNTEPIANLDMSVSSAERAPSTEGEAFDRVANADGAGTLAQQSRERLVIKDGDLTLNVDDIRTTISAITTLAADHGGYVISTTTNRADNGATGTITIAVEASQFETAMNAIRDLAGEVVHDSATGEDVTAEYVDLESRLQSLEATRARVLTFLEQARNAEEALAVNAQLADLEQQIEQVKGRMAYLEGRAAFSTITVQLRDAVAGTSENEGWSPGNTLSNAFDAQVQLVRALLDAAIWFAIVPGPYVLAIVVIAAVLRRQRRRVPPTRSASD